VIAKYHQPEAGPVELESDGPGQLGGKSVEIPAVVTPVVGHPSSSPLQNGATSNSQSSLDIPRQG